MHEELPKMVEGSSAQGRAEEPSQTHQGTGAGNGARQMGKCKYCETPIDLTPNIRGKIRTTCSVICVKRAWKARNPENRKEDYAKNKERYAQRSREWGLANPLRKQARNRAWRARNLDYALECEKERRMRDKEKLKAWNAHRSLIMKSAPKDEKKRIVKWKKEWKALPIVKCNWCEKDFPALVCQSDHIVALGRGGAHALSNLCISCRPCNQAKSVLNVEQWKERIA